MKRPAPYVPLSVAFATGKTGTTILEKFGPAGLGVWAAMLAAAKRENGQITFYHDDDWASIGLAAHRPDFPLMEFVTFLGRLKQTRSTRSGRVRYVVFTSWKSWNQEFRDEEEVERKRRKRRVSTPDTKPPSLLQKPALEVEIEREVENTPLTPLEGGNGEVGAIYSHWRSARSRTDNRYDRISDKRRDKIKARLAEFPAAELIRAIDGVALDPWEDRPLHDDLTIIFRDREHVEKFLEFADSPPASSNGNLNSRCPECGIGFPGERTLTSHLRTVHGVEQREESAA